MSRANVSQKDAMKSHFARAGVKFDISPEFVLRQLEKLMGSERFEEWYEVSMQRHHGERDVSEEYALLTSASEVNAFFSFQSQASLEVALWLAQKVSQHCTTGQQICDLGCSSGVLASWLATQHVGCNVIGVDALECLLRCARESCSLPNLRFQQWDYLSAKPDDLAQSDVLVSSFGIDFPPEFTGHESLDPTTLRGSPRYLARKELVKPFFSNWRDAIKDDGYLFAVLRLPHDTDFLAVVDAAHETGWSFVGSESTKLVAGDERFPAMTFQARQSSAPSEEELLSLWAEADIRHQFAAPIMGTTAVVVFNALGNKRILKSESKTFADGHTMVTSIGTSGAIAFSFSRATNGSTRLQVVPLTQVGSLAVKFHWDDKNANPARETGDRQPSKSRTKPTNGKRR